MAASEWHCLYNSKLIWMTYSLKGIRSWLFFVQIICHLLFELVNSAAKTTKCHWKHPFILLFDDLIVQIGYGLTLIVVPCGLHFQNSDYLTIETGNFTHFPTLELLMTEFWCCNVTCEHLFALLNQFCGFRFNLYWWKPKLFLLRDCYHSKWTIVLDGVSFVGVWNLFFALSRFSLIEGDFIWIARMSRNPIWWYARLFFYLFPSLCIRSTNGWEFRWMRNTHVNGTDVLVHIRRMNTIDISRSIHLTK